MSLKRRLMPHVAQALTSRRRRAVGRGLAELRRRLAGRPHRVRYFHRACDPYALLTVQVLADLERRFDIQITPHVVFDLPQDMYPERALLDAYAVTDARRLAGLYGLAFPDGTAPAGEDIARHAALVLAGLQTDAGFADTAQAVGRAVLAGDWAALTAIEDAHRDRDPSAGWARLAQSEALLGELGHYLSASFFYGGEWYWGLDRLDHLERRLAGLGLARDGGGTPAFERTWRLGDGPAVAAAPDRPIELFFSVRSPYSYIALERTLRLARRWRVPVALRPVLPMMMRGLPVPRVKRVYILTDAKREADKLGLPFGRIADPLGAATERCYALVDHATDRGKRADLLLSFMRGAFADGIDGATDAGMKRIVERAGLDWAAARPHLDDPDWRAWAEDNRRALTAMGLWGVPCFRYGAVTAWGQDRLWVIEQAVRRQEEVASGGALG